ncbi:MAG: transglutaminase-like domain-containing protein [Eubacteriales bacterium]
MFSFKKIRMAARAALIIMLCALTAVVSFSADFCPLMPEAGGKTVFSSGGSYIDATFSSQGYIMARQTGVSEKLKIQISLGDVKYNYSLRGDGVFEVFPLQLGNGKYTVKIFRNISGTKYSALFTAEIDVALAKEISPYLYPNQYVSYTEDSECVKKAAELCGAVTGDLAKLQTVNDYLSKNIKYDVEKAKTVKSGYLPDPDETLSDGYGICFDYAALMCAMLRSQGVPAKLIIGTVAPKALNHAWVSVYVKGKGWITTKIYSDGNNWKLMDPTYAAAGSSAIEEFIGDATNYTALRWY